MENFKNVETLADRQPFQKDVVTFGLVQYLSRRYSSEQKF